MLCGGVLTVSCVLEADQPRQNGHWQCLSSAAYLQPGSSFSVASSQERCDGFAPCHLPESPMICDFFFFFKKPSFCRQAASLGFHHPAPSCLFISFSHKSKYVEWSWRNLRLGGGGGFQNGLVLVWREWELFLPLPSNGRWFAVFSEPFVGKLFSSQWLML